MFEAMDVQLLGREFYLKVQVGDQWKGVHVHNQSQGDGAELIRHSGNGNRVKFIKSTQVPDGYHILVEVGGAWKGVHVHNQSADDNARLIRHSGDGNVFRFVKNAQGTYNLLVQAHLNYTEWKGVHVNCGSHNDGTPLIRYRDTGHAFQFQEIASPDAAVQTEANELDRKLLTGEFHLSVQVGDEWKGVHVQNQSRHDGAQLVRHHGPGNRVKFVKSTVVPDGYHLLMKVGNEWKGIHVHEQSPYDHTSMVRHEGNGNIFKVVPKADGKYNLMVQVDLDYVDWKGIHVTSQHAEDNVPLIRDQGEGNVFRIEKA
jgi:catechol 2,3-dioxygenase-like lactoylglutathione lyase family enzyme